MHMPALQAATELNKPEYTNLSRLLNIIASLLVFLLPAFTLAKLLNKKPFQQLGFRSTISVKQLLLLLAITVTGIFLSGALGEFNEWIPIPHNFYVWAKEKEDAYKTTMMSMATMKSLTDYLLALLVLGAGPAIVEEIFFRGGLQQVMVGWTKNKWVGIIITSALFSAVHISYFGFLPRLALGLILGLIFYESKNIWLSILLHFLNNALVVTQLYVAGRQGKVIDKTVDENVPVWLGILALAILILLFRSFRKESNKVLAAREASLQESSDAIISN